MFYQSSEKEFLQNPDFKVYLEYLLDNQVFLT